MSRFGPFIAKNTAGYKCGYYSVNSENNGI